MNVLPAVIGLVGLYQQQQQQKAQQDLVRKGVKMDDQIKGVQLEGLKELGGLARGYDPAAETQTAIANAANVTGNTLEKSMRNLVAEYAKYGGVPGTSSRWNTNLQGMTDRVTDPLRQFAAERAVGDTKRKMDAWTQAIGAAPGNFGDSYFKAASFMTPQSPAGSFQALLQGLASFTQRRGGGGGSGDLRDAGSALAGGLVGG